MKFPIDVVGVDRNRRVVRLWRALAPYRVTSVSLRMTSVLELAAGRIDEAGIELGDELAILKPSS
jgi:uncharacterized membrane protein (UPF0127 family)